MPSPRALSLAVLSLFVACSEEPLPPIAALAEPVIGGTAASPCSWPSTVMVNGATSCTGTLIHPRVVTTAAHCLSGSSARITFGAGRNAPGAFTVTGQCKAGANGESGVNSARDWGYCVLPEDDRIKQIPYTPPLVGCEAERFLKPGVSAWIVGFGATENGSSGSKRQVEVVVNQLDKRAKGTIDVGDAKVGACHGDSGGPIYLHLQDGASDYGYRVFGSTSGPGAAQCDCSCSTTYVNISNHVAQIEANEKIDVTPCTDAQGAWAPGPACSALIDDPQMGSGTFPSCSVGHTVQPIATCGAPGAPAAGSGAAGSAAGGGAAGSAGAGMSAAGSGAAGNAAGGGAGSAGLQAGASGTGVAGASVGLGAPIAAGSAATAQPQAVSAAGTAGQGSLTSGIQAAGAPASVRPAEPVAPAPRASGCATLDPGRGNVSAGFLIALALLSVRARRRRH